MIDETNEEKARKISGLCKDCSDRSCYTSRRMCKFLMQYDSALEMARWKEEQIFDALKQLGYDAALVAVKQLINNQNNKDNDKKIDYEDIDDACFVADSYIDD